MYRAFFRSVFAPISSVFTVFTLCQLFPYNLVSLDPPPPPPLFAPDSFS